MEPLIQVSGLCTRFGERWIHRDIGFDVYRGEVFAIVGASGSGKSVLLRELVFLQPPTSGSILLFGRETVSTPERRLLPLRRRFGVLFQDGALFSGMNVLQNVGFPMREQYPQLPERLVEQLALVKLGLVGLEPRVGLLRTRELSGGMRKRVALARAMALDPELLFLDEPSSGLDPVSAAAFDDLILRLSHSLALTVVMVTHDMDSLWRVADRVVLLSDARAAAVGSMPELAASGQPEVRRFFGGPRGRAAQEAAWTQK